MAVGAHAELDVGARQREFVEEHAGELAVVVLAGVEQYFARHLAHGARHDRRLDVLGPVAHHRKDDRAAMAGSLTEAAGVCTRGRRSDGGPARPTAVATWVESARDRPCRTGSRRLAARPRPVPARLLSAQAVAVARAVRPPRPPLLFRRHRQRQRPGRRRPVPVARRLLLARPAHAAAAEPRTRAAVPPVLRRRRRHHAPLAHRRQPLLRRLRAQLGHGPRARLAGLSPPPAARPHTAHPAVGRGHRRARPGLRLHLSTTLLLCVIALVLRPCSTRCSRPGAPDGQPGGRRSAGAAAIE